MGLFRKRSNDPVELDHLRSEIAAMAARLDAADADKAQLDHRLHSIVTKIDEVPPPAPPPPPPVIDAADVDIIRARIQRLYDLLDETAATQPLAAEPAIDPDTITLLEARIDQMAAELAAALVDHDGDPSTPPTIDPAEFAALIERVEAIGNRLDTPRPPPPPIATPAAPEPSAVDTDEIEALRSHLAQLHERVAAIDLRITSISTELANQITELSGDIETLGTPPPASVATDTPIDDGAVIEIVDELRGAQVKLANEQARYQIALRQELAELAERLRRA